MTETTSPTTALIRRRDRNDPTLPVILEFQWPSTAVANAPIPRSARGVTWVVTSMVLVLIAVFGFIPVDQVITARGIVISRSPDILIQPLDTSIVRSIDVHEGQRVKAGELLAQLDPTFATADLDSLKSQVSSLGAEVARLQAEASGQAFKPDASNPDDELQEAIYEHRNAEYQLRIENYNHRIDELKSEVARSDSDAVGYRNRLGVAQDTESIRKELERRELGSKLNTLAAQDSSVEMARALANAEATGQAAERDLKAMTSERDGFVQSWSADIAQSLSDSKRKFDDANEQLKKAQLRRTLVQLRADRDAIVQSVARVSVGSVLLPGQPFLTLVPSDAPLEVEANIAGSETGFVHVGDSVSVKFDTFPFSQYGMAEGTVRVISPSSFTAQEDARNPTSAVPLSPTATEPYYRARVTLDRIALHNIPNGFQVTPGMPVAADIKVGKRTVLKYLLGRVLPVAQESMREP